MRFEEDEGRTMRRGWERTWVCGVKARDTEAEKSFSISSELQARSIYGGDHTDRVDPKQGSIYTAPQRNRSLAGYSAIGAL